jgi:hypothetical protein
MGNAIIVIDLAYYFNQLYVICAAKISLKNEDEDQIYFSEALRYIYI